MLLELSIRNVALIERLRIDLNGDSKYTPARTGAGKSFLGRFGQFGAGRARPRALGAHRRDRATVHAVFDMPPGADSLLTELGRRGRGRRDRADPRGVRRGRVGVRINGQLVPTAHSCSDGRCS